ncbi:MAG: alpha/beta hydrolase [Burkholderiaceae bacterium]
MNLEGSACLRPIRPKRRPVWAAVDQLQTPLAPSVSADLAAVAARLIKNNPRLRPELAAWLAPHWSARQPDGSWRILSDPAHKRVNPYLYRVDEVVACWAQISAPVLWVFCEHMKSRQAFVDSPEYADRLSVIPTLRRATVAGAGHMMHHDQPEAVASMIQEFL